MSSRYPNYGTNNTPPQRGRNVNPMGSSKDSSSGFPISNTNSNNNGLRNEPLQKYKLIPPTDRKQLSNGLGIPDFFPLLPIVGSLNNPTENIPEDSIDEKSISSGFSEPILFDEETSSIRSKHMSHMDIFSLKSNLLQSLKQLEWSKSSNNNNNNNNSITSSTSSSSESISNPITSSSSNPSNNKTAEKTTPSIVVGNIALQYPGQIVCSKEFSEKWLKSLSTYSENSLLKLSSRVPYSYKGDSLLRLILKDRIPLARATWYIKVSYLNIVYGDSNSVSNSTSSLSSSLSSSSSSSSQFNKKQETDPPIDWTNTVTQFLNVQLKELFKSLREITSSTSITSIVSQSMIATSTSNRIKENYAYLTRLIHWQYNEGLLHSDLFFTKLIEFINDVHFLSPSSSSTNYAHLYIHNNFSRPEELCIVITLLMEYLHDLCFHISAIPTPSSQNNNINTNNTTSTTSSINSILPFSKRLLLILLEKQKHLRDMEILVNESATSNSMSSGYLGWIRQSINKAKLSIESCLRYILYVCPHFAIMGQDRGISIHESLEQISSLSDDFSLRSLENEKLIIQNIENIKNTIVISPSLKSNLSWSNASLELDDFFRHGDIGRLFQKVFNVPSTGKKQNSKETELATQTIKEIFEWSVSSSYYSISSFHFPIASNRMILVCQLLDMYVRSLSLSSKFPLQQVLLDFLVNYEPETSQETSNVSILYSELIRRNMFSHNLYLRFLVSSSFGFNESNQTKHRNYLQSIYICTPSNLRKIYFAIACQLNTEGNEISSVDQIEEKEKGNTLINQRRAILMDLSSSSTSLQNLFTNQLKKETESFSYLQQLVSSFVSSLQLSPSHLCIHAQLINANTTVQCRYCCKRFIFQFLHNIKYANMSKEEVHNPVFILYSFSDWLISSILPNYFLNTEVSKVSSSSSSNEQIELEIGILVLEILYYINATTSLSVVILNYLKYLNKLINNQRYVPLLHVKLLDIIVNYSLSNYYIFMYMGNRSILDLYVQVLSSLYSTQMKETEKQAISIVRHAINYLSFKFSVKIDSITQKSMDQKDLFKYLDEEVNSMLFRKRSEVGEWIADQLQSIWNSSKQLTFVDSMKANSERIQYMINMTISSLFSTLKQGDPISSIFNIFGEICSLFAHGFYFNVDHHSFDFSRKELSSLLLILYNQSKINPLEVDKLDKETKEYLHFSTSISLISLLLHKHVISIEDLLLSSSFTFNTSLEDSSFILQKNIFLFSFLLLGHHVFPCISTHLFPSHGNLSSNEEVIRFPFPLVLTPVLHNHFTQHILIPIVLYSNHSPYFQNLIKSSLISLLCQLTIPDIFTGVQSLEKLSSGNSLITTKYALSSLIDIIGNKMEVNISTNMETILSKLDKWNTRICWLEIQAYLESIPKESSHEFSKSLIHSILIAFLTVVNQEDKKESSNNVKNTSPSVADYFTLISMLDSMQKNILIDEISQMLKDQIKSIKKIQKIENSENQFSLSSLLNNGKSLEFILPLLSFLASEDQKYAIVHSLISQLEELFAYSTSSLDSNESHSNLQLHQYLDFQNAVQIRTALLSNILPNPKSSRGSMITSQQASIISSSAKSLLKYLSLLSSPFFATSNLFYSLAGTLNDILNSVQLDVTPENERDKLNSRSKSLKSSTSEFMFPFEPMQEGQFSSSSNNNINLYLEKKAGRKRSKENSVGNNSSWIYLEDYGPLNPIQLGGTRAPKVNLSYNIQKKPRLNL